jgi:hypothetical protein
MGNERKSPRCGFLALPLFLSLLTSQFSLLTSIIPVRLPMNFRKSPQARIDAFDAVVPGPPAQRRQMFGYPAVGSGAVKLGKPLKDSRTALERAEELLLIATEHGLRYHHATGAFFRGWARADEGRGQEGLAEMSRALPDLEGSAVTTLDLRPPGRQISQDRAPGRRACDGGHGAKRNGA